MALGLLYRHDVILGVDEVDSVVPTSPNGWTGSAAT